MKKNNLILKEFILYYFISHLKQTFIEFSIKVFKVKNRFKDVATVVLA